MAVYKKTSFSAPLDSREITNQMPDKQYLPQSLQDSMTTVDQLATSTKSGRWFICLCGAIVGTDDRRAKDQFYPVYYAVDSSNNVIGNVVAAPCPPFCTDDTGAILEERITHLEGLVEKIAEKLERIPD